ncbi:MAG: putative polymerase [Acidimicrobiales bacterium]|nr:putative polymerase [Acidimicrobiales bacterium]
MSSLEVGIEALRERRVQRGDLVGLALAPGVGVGLAFGSERRGLTATDPAALVAAIDAELRPRWVVWDSATAAVLVAAGVRLATNWDVAAVHRLLVGGWRADPARVWAHHRGLPLSTIPATGPVDLFTSMERDDGDPEDPERADGHLRPEWVEGGWAATPDRLAKWAALAAEVAVAQQIALAELATAPPPDGRPQAPSTARSESTAELLCAELAFDGLPMDRGVAEGIIAAVVGPRPRDEREAARQRAERDQLVLRHAPDGSRFDLRSPGQVRSLLRRVGIEVPDTRAWRLEALRDAHPLVEALLAWRKAERVSTTFGYGWLDEQLGADGRLHGQWSACDGGAGRMTASAGLHNMPADLREAVVAEPGSVFVRADLGQIEPRVLAAVSGDRVLARATQEEDLYAPVAARLSVDRATAKVAVLGAMYGQTTGHGAQALRGLQSAYPVAMSYLESADRAAQGGRALRTYGGRLVPIGTGNVNELSASAARSQAAARGRYGRNALVQGAAAELFKVWAVTVRARGAEIGARVVLCLHDELLVHVPVERGDAAADLVDEALQEAASRWAPDPSVRFLADTSVVGRWSDAK